MMTYRIRLLTTYVGLLVFLGVGISVQAADFSAGTAQELIDAVNVANANSDASTITLTADITLIAIDNNNETDEHNGLPAISTPITIEGAGFTIARSNADDTPDFRILYINESGDLTLKNVTLENGRTNRGGGILNQAGRLTLQNSVVHNNSNIFGAGGGIRTTNGSVTLENSTISANSQGGIASINSTVSISHSIITGNITAGYGGGIGSYESEVIIQNSLIAHNASSGGGAIYSRQSVININHSELTRNTGFENSAGFFNEGGTVTIRNSAIHENDAKSILATGGFRNDGGTVTIQNSTIANNRGGPGEIFPFADQVEPPGIGGVYNQNGTVTLQNNTIINNSGGGIYNVNGTITLENSIVAGNSSQGGTRDCESASPEGINTNGRNLFGTNGDAGNCPAGESDIVPDGSLAGIIHTTLADNGGLTPTLALVEGSPAIDASGNNATENDQRGASVVRTRDIGAFEYTARDFIVRDENAADSGQRGATAIRPPNIGTFDPDAAELSVSNATELIQAINAANISSEASIITLTADITLNAIDNRNAYREDNGLPAIRTNITIEGNGFRIVRSDADDTPRFRILYIGENGHLILKNTTLENGNTFKGGGILNDAGILTLQNSTVANNQATIDGAGIFNYAGITELIDSTVVRNTIQERGVYTGGAGGGIYNETGTVMLQRTSILVNAISGASGGGGIANSGEMIITNSTIVNNTIGNDRSPAWGGGIYNRRGTLTITNSTLSGNNALNDSGGIHNWRGTLTLTNSIIAYSTGDDYRGEDHRGGSGTITLKGNNIVEDGSLTEQGAISGDPMLGDLADNGGPTQTQALLPGSPAIDASGEGATDTDQRGAPAVGTRDIGAFEFGGVVPENGATND